jgi:hypothetical protein
MQTDSNLAEIFRKTYLDDKTLIVGRYDTETGEFAFGSGGSLFRNYLDQINKNPFRVMNELKKAFADVDMKRIAFQAVGLTKKEAESRDRLYDRVLTRAGYKCTFENDAGFFSKFKQGILSGCWSGPARGYVLEEIK